MTTQERNAFVKEKIKSLEKQGIRNVSTLKVKEWLEADEERGLREYFQLGIEIQQAFGCDEPIEDVEALFQEFRKAEKENIIKL